MGEICSIPLAISACCQGQGGKSQSLEVRRSECFVMINIIVLRTVVPEMPNLNGITLSGTPSSTLNQRVEPSPILGGEASGDSINKTSWANKKIKGTGITAGLFPARQRPAPYLNWV